MPHKAILAGLAGHVNVFFAFLRILFPAKFQQNRIYGN